MTIRDFFGICEENIGRIFMQAAAGNDKKIAGNRNIFS